MDTIVTRRWPMVRVVVAVLLLLLWAGLAHAGVVFDAFGNSGEAVGPSSPQTFTITLGAGTKGLLVHIVGRMNGGSITGVTVGTATLSLVSGTTVDSSSSHGEVWGGTTTDTGSQTGSVSFSGSPTTLASAGFSATGVNTSTPVNNGNTTSGSSFPISLAMTSNSGDLTVTAVYAQGGTSDVTTNFTRKWEDISASDPAGGDIGDGSSNPTHTWSNGGVAPTTIIITGANFQAASVSATPQRTLMGVGL